MNRVFLNTIIEDPQNIIIKDKEIIKKLIKVMRLSVKDNFIIFDKQSVEYLVEIKEITPKQIICQFVSKSEIDRELEIEINLYQALLKKDKFEWIVQKATEIGVKKIIPVVSEFCVVRDLTKNKLVRYQKIINEATMQCGGKIPPQLETIQDFSESIAGLPAQDLNIIAYESESGTKLKDIINNKRINLFIGPEGGFSQEEISIAQRNSVRPFSLGKRILRAETAAIISCGIISQIYA